MNYKRPHTVARKLAEELNANHLDWYVPDYAEWYKKGREYVYANSKQENAETNHRNSGEEPYVTVDTINGAGLIGGVDGGAESKEFIENWMRKNASNFQWFWDGVSGNIGIR